MDSSQEDDGRKPLSVAIDEIYQGKVQILSDEEGSEEKN
jgi:DNA-directed RNA polymerase subunit K/omega